MGTTDFGLHNILIYEMKNREGKGGKYSKKEKVTTDTYTNAQTNFPLVDSTLSKEGAGPFCGWGRVKNWNKPCLLLYNILFQECLINKNGYN